MQNNENKSVFIQKEYQKEYRKSHYKQIAVDVSENDKNIISEYCKSMKISQAKFLVSAARYCIDNAIDIDELLSHMK